MLIATPNLCLDRTEMVSAVVAGSVMRARSVEVTAGGKGVNVARVMRAFGQQPPIVGLVAERNGPELLDLLAGEGATVVPVATPGWVRLAIVMIEETAGRITVLNEPGPLISPQVWADYQDSVRYRLPGRRLLVCSGSLPPGVPPDGYGRLVELAREAGVMSIVDTAPVPLAATLPYGPGLVTPNLEEAEAALSGDIGDVLHSHDEDVPSRAAKAARELCERGARRAAVTAGADGVAFADAETGAAQWFPAVRVDVVSTVGAGDSFVGGLAVELLGLPELPPSPDQWAAAFHRAVATAAASCEQLRAGGVEPERVAQLLDLVRGRHERQKGAAERRRRGGRHQHEDRQPRAQRRPAGRRRHPRPRGGGHRRPGLPPDPLARSLRRGTDEIVGVVVDSIADPFFASVTGEIEKIAFASGLTVTVGSTGRSIDRERIVVDGLARRKVAGMIVAPASQDHAYLQELSCAVVFIDRSPVGLDVDSVLVDDFQGAYLAVRHLIAHGHSSIAYIGDFANLETADKRLAGYRAAFADAGLPVDGDMIAADCSEIADAELRTGELLASDPRPPTAIFSANTRCSMGVAPALHTLSKTDIAMVGFGDFFMAASLQPAVTVIDHSPELIGQLAAERLFLRMSGLTEPPRRIQAPIHLVARGSGELAAVTDVAIGVDIGTTDTKALVIDLRERHPCRLRPPPHHVDDAPGRAGGDHRRRDRHRRAGRRLGRAGPLARASARHRPGRFRRERHTARPRRPRPGAGDLVVRPARRRGTRRPGRGFPRRPARSRRAARGLPVHAGETAVAARHRILDPAGTQWLEHPRVRRARAGRRPRHRTVAGVPDRPGRPGHRRPVASSHTTRRPAAVVPATRPARGRSAGRVTHADAPQALRGAEITVVGHDHPVAAIGAGAVAPNVLFNSTGTADVLLRTVPGPLTAAERARLVDAGYSAGAHVLPGHAALIGSVWAGLVLGRVLDLLGRNDVAGKAELDRRWLPGCATATSWSAVPGRPTPRSSSASRTAPGPDACGPPRLAHVAAETAALLAAADRIVGPHATPSPPVAGCGWPVSAPRSSAVLPGLRFTGVDQPGAFGAALFAAWTAAGNP